MKKLALFLLILPSVLAAIDFDEPLTPQEEQTFDAILAPVMKVYKFIQYSATVIGVLMLVFAGILFATAGGENRKKDSAKNMAVGVVIGLGLVWVAPLVVQYLLS